MARDAATEATNVAGALTSMSIEEMVSSLAIGIAEGQMALDEASMQIAEFMGESKIAFGKKPGTDIPDLMSLIELGFTPNFYQFVDTILEMRVSVKTSYSQKRETNVKQKNIHIDSAKENTNYENNRSRVDSGKRSQSSSASNSSTVGYRFGWWGGSVTRGNSSSQASASDSGVRTSNSSKYGRNTSKENKNVSVSTVDAKFSAKYQYSVEASSTIKTKIVPIPAPEVLEEIIRGRIEERKEEEQRFIWTQQVKSLVPSIRQIAQGIFRKAQDSAVPDEGAIENVGTTLHGIDLTAMNTELPKLKNVRKFVKALLAKYNELSNDHWAIIDNIPDRETVDDAIEFIPENIEKLIVDMELRKEYAVLKAKDDDATATFTALTSEEISEALSVIRQSTLDLAQALENIGKKYVEKELEAEPLKAEELEGVPVIEM